MNRARKFYEGTLGLVKAVHTEKEGFTWVEYNVGNSTLGLGSGMPDWKASEGGGCVAFEVENFDDAVTTLKKAGSKFKLDPFETPVCHMAVVLDPDGNSVMIHKCKPGHV